MPGPDLSAWAQPTPSAAPDLAAFAEPPRALLERFTQNAADALNRSSVATLARNLDPSGDGRLGADEFLQMPRLVPGGPLDRVAQMFGAAPAAPLPVNHAVEQERARRETFANTAAADPFYQAPGGLLGRTAAGAATLAGQLAGSATDPLNFAAPGKTILQRAALAAPVNAGADALTQLGDMGQGVQDKFSPTQTLAAGALGPLLSVGGDLAVPAARAAGGVLARGVEAARRAMPDLSAFGRPPPVEIGRDPLTGGLDIKINESTNPDFLRGREAQAEGVASNGKSQGPDLSDFATDADAPPFDVAPADAATETLTKPSAPAPRDFTAEALDIIRSGSTVRLDRGPSLIEFLSRNGGLRDDGGELSALDADRWHRDRPFRNQLVREGGLSVEEAASRARDAGFFNDLAPATMEGSANTQIGGEVLIDAVRRELAGEPRYSREADPQTADLAQHMADLDELLSVAGIDTKKGSPEDIRAAIDTFLRAPDPERAFALRPRPVLGRLAAPKAGPQPDLVSLQARLRKRLAPQIERVNLADGAAVQGVIPGVGPVSPSARDLAAEAQRSATALGAAPPPAGGLFDEAARAQGDFFDTPSGKLGVIDLSSYGEPVAPSRGLGLRAAPVPGAVPRAPGAKPQHIESTSLLAERLKQALGLIHRQGRMTLKKAMGEYDTSSGIIRTKVVHEIDVLAHEGGHALEFKPGHPTVKAALKAFATELAPLAYPGADPRHMREEGFAEWFRWYVTNPAKAAAEAPGFTAAFEAALTKDAPQTFRDLAAIRERYQALLSSASVDVARSAVVWPSKDGMAANIARAVKLQGVMATVRDLADDAYSATFDRLNPIKVAVRRLLKVAEENTGKRYDLKAAADPYKLSRLAVEPYTAGQMDVLHGVTPYRGIDPEGPSLSEAIGKALGDDWSNDRLEEFGTYLVARRMVQEWKRRDRGELKRDPHSLPATVWKTVISDLEGANPTWAEAARSVHEWTQNLWRKQYESGLIGATTYDAGRKMADYVPLQRDLSDKMRGVAGVKGDAQFAGGVKEFKGSTRDIINPLRSLMERAQRVSAIISRNDVFKALDDLGQRAGAGGGAIVERIPASEAAAVHVNVIEALEKAAKDAGLHEADYTDLLDEAAKMLDGNEIVPLFQSGVINTKGEPILFLWKNGRREAIRLADGKFGRDLYTVLAGLEEDPRSLVVDLLAKPTQLLRAGVTLSPDFMAANYIRDQVSATILSDVGYKPFLTGARGLFDELSQSAFARRYYTNGGMRGGANTASLSKGKVASDLKAFRKKGYAIRRLTTWRGLTELTELSERSTRIGLFRLAYQKAKKGGLSDFEAIKEAAFEARDVMDFDRYGSRMLAARRVVTFLNAGLQGLDKMRRVLTADGDWLALAQPWSKVLTGRDRKAAVHAYKALGMMLGLGMLGAQLAAIYKDDPEYQEISDYLRATHWLFKAPGGEWVSVPKPFELAVFSNIAERAVESQDDPTAWGRMVKGLGEIMVPPHEIPAVAVPYQIAKNRDYNGRPIIPDHLRGTVEPDMQFTSYTSELAKFIGRHINVAPAVVDHVITGIGGTAGRYVTQATDAAVFGKSPQAEMGPEDQVLVRRFVRDENRGATSQAKFWDLVSKDGGDLTKAEGSFRALMKTADDKAALAYLNKLPPEARAYVLSQVFTQGGSSKLHPMTRAQAELSVIAELRRDLKEPTLRGYRGDPLPLTPAVRRKADDALAALATADMRAALIASGVKGWTQKAPLSRDAAIGELSAAQPALAEELAARLALDKVPPPEASEAFWRTAGPAYARSADPGSLEAIMSAKRATSGDLLSKLRERNRQAEPSRGLLAQPKRSGLLAR